MNNRNVDILRIAKIKNTFSSSIANTAMQVTSAHDQRYSTFKMAADVIKKTNIRGCEQAKVTTQKKKYDGIILYHVLPFLLCPFHIIVAHRKWTITFYFTALPRTIAPAPLLRLRDNYADIRQETVYYHFLHKWVEGCKCIFKSNISQRSPSFYGRLC